MPLHARILPKNINYMLFASPKEELEHPQSGANKRLIRGVTSTDTRIPRPYPVANSVVELCHGMVSKSRQASRRISAVIAKDDSERGSTFGNDCQKDLQQQPHTLLRLPAHTTMHGT
jgi:hypothetical protein